MERLIGSIRHECLNRLIVTSEEHLRKVLKGYFRIFSISDDLLRAARGMAALTPVLQRRHAQQITEDEAEVTLVAKSQLQTDFGE
jgi:hypothetical protein